MKARPGDGDAEQVVRHLARELVAETRRLGWAGPPFDPEMLASLLGIKVTEGPRDMIQDAMIRPLPNGRLEIIYNPDIPIARRNFSICHEIAHTLFPDCYEAVRHRNSSHRSDSEKELESLCDAAAAEILMPYPDFVQDARATGVNLGAIDILRERYRASREAIAIRLVHTDIVPVAAAVLTLRLKPIEERGVRQVAMSFVTRPEVKLRTDLMVGAPSFSSEWMPKHKSIPDSSVLYQLLEAASVETVSGREAWDTGKGRLPRCVVHGMRIPVDAQGRTRVMAFLFSDP